MPAPGSGELSVDDVTIKTDRTPGGDGVYETTELVETFTVDSGGYAEEAPTHDAAGNMTYDGIYAYSYDAWNRMVKVTKAWRTGNLPGGALNTGSVISESNEGPSNVSKRM